jgi:hypothetical protein
MSGGVPYALRTGANVGNRQSGMSQVQGDVVPKGYQMGQMQQFTPEQMDLFKQLFSYLSPDGDLGRMASGDQSYFEQLEKPAMRQLGQMQSQLASRFSGMGSFGGRRSSGHDLAQGQLGSEFAEKLASQRMGLQRQALQDLFGMSQSLFGQRPTERFLIQNAPKESSFLEQLLGASLPMAGAGLGALFGGVPGAFVGGSIGSQASKGFMGY